MRLVFNMKQLFLLVVLGYLCATCVSLRCQTDDGVTEEDVRRIVRVCMRKVGENDEDNSEYDEDSSDYDDDGEEDGGQRGGGGGRRKNTRYGDDYRQRSRDHSRYFRKSFKNGYYDDYEGYSRNNNRRGEDRDRTGGQNVSLTDKQTERDKACVVHCFFQEMKMVNLVILIINYD